MVPTSFAILLTVVNIHCLILFSVLGLNLMPHTYRHSSLLPALVFEMGSKFAKWALTLCSLDKPWAVHPPTSVSWVAGITACTFKINYVLLLADVPRGKSISHFKGNTPDFRLGLSRLKNSAVRSPVAESGFLIMFCFESNIKQLAGGKKLTS